MPYIIMNKEENRIQVEDAYLPIVFSGELGNRFVASFSPVIYGSRLKAKIKAFWYGVKAVEVFTEDTGFEVGCYKYLTRVSTGIVYQVWDSSAKYKPQHCSTFDVELPEVMIKGIGVFPHTDFQPFNF